MTALNAAKRSGASTLVIGDGLAAADMQAVHALGALLRTDISAPIVFLLTLNLDDAAPPLRRLWTAWEEELRVFRLRLSPLPTPEAVRLARSLLPEHLHEDGRAELVARVSGGNPGMISELCAWDSATTGHDRPCGDGTDPEEGFVAKDSYGGPTAISRRRVAAANGDNVLSVPALADHATSPGMISDVLGVDLVKVSETLDRGVAAGLVSHTGDEEGPRYQLTHPLVRYLLVDAVTPQERAQVHRRLSGYLGRIIAGRPSPLALRAAQHRRDGGLADSVAAHYYYLAAAWFLQQGQGDRAVRACAEGRACRPDAADLARLLEVEGLSNLRLRRKEVGLRLLLDAVDAARATDDGSLFASVTVTLLAELPASQAVTADVGEALTRCPEDELGLRAQLLARSALQARPAGENVYVAKACEAVKLAWHSGDLGAVGAVIGLFAESSPPHLAPVLSRSAARIRQVQDVVAEPVMPALLYTAIREGRREAFEAIALEVAERGLASSAPSGRRLAVAIELAAGLIDVDERRAVAAALDADGGVRFCLPPRRMLRLLWRFHTGRSLGTPLPNDVPVKETDHMRLLSAAELLLRSESRTGGGSLVATATPSWPAPGSVPHDETWAVWLVLHARAAVLAGESRLAADVVQELLPFRHEFAVIPPGIPIVPVGWVLSDLFELLDRPEDAMASCEQAEELSRSLRARAWVARCLTQRARLIKERDRVSAIAALAEARHLALDAGLFEIASTADAQIRLLAHREFALPVNDEPEPPVRPDGPSDETATLLKHLCGGRTNAEIARLMYCSVATVERRLTGLYRRYGVKNRAQLVAILLTRHNSPDRSVRPRSNA
ncbi:helix-turn-helix transcriptional regulator [Micromonospora sp. KC721]|uniref:helix-turn-helix transcriptional regulator n=1 Tax=Micromonospora sp. KC721 TaxID=2530380 RepID=UPI001404AE8D|nr:helix-turn-helix transcriptional regulator [Micromonospora sp. KC721]